MDTDHDRMLRRVEKEWKRMKRGDEWHDRREADANFAGSEATPN